MAKYVYTNKNISGEKMVKINKLYKKAMDCYCDGRLNSALRYCDKVLNMDRSHSPTLNLKGLINYIRGDLEEARMLWKLSYKLNGDMVSRKYLDDSRTDEGDIHIFNQGVLFFNEVRIREALNCFLKCESSHFNSINLWSYLAKCYMKLGEHTKAIKYVSDILNLDRSNREAFKLKSQLVELGFIPRQRGRQIKKGAMVFAVSVVAMCSIVLLGALLVKGYGKVEVWIEGRQEDRIAAENDNKTNLDNFQGNIEETTGKDTNIKEENVENKKQEETLASEKSFDVGILKGYIAAEDYENIISYIGNHDVEVLEINDNIVVQKGRDLIKEKGVLALYEKGNKHMKDEEYLKAIDSFKLVYDYSEGTYLNEH
ncbi:MAG: tetratricopeptide repeat protein, partial [Peptostreptococcaceae bacterium]